MTRDEEIARQYLPTIASREKFATILAALAAARKDERAYILREVLDICSAHANIYGISEKCLDDIRALEGKKAEMAKS